MDTKQLIRIVIINSCSKYVKAWVDHYDAGEDGKLTHCDRRSSSLRVSHTILEVLVSNGLTDKPEKLKSFPLSCY